MAVVMTESLVGAGDTDGEIAWSNRSDCFKILFDDDIVIKESST